MSKRPSDAQQRERALDPTQSFICEAPAGSGKTELLTQRVLTLLARVERPEQVLAITFTRKAAGEMRERVFHAIQSGQQSRPTENHKIKTWELANKVLQADLQYQWHLLENPNRLQIKTFDSLCASLANTLPLESGFGAKPQVADEPMELYQKAARALLHSLEDNEDWSEGLTVLLAQLDNQYARLEELLIALLMDRDQWLPLMPNVDKNNAPARNAIRAILESNLQTIIEDTLTHVRNLIPANLHREIVSLAGYAAKNLELEGKNSAILNCLNIDLENIALPHVMPGENNTQAVAQWRGIKELLLTGKGEWRASLDKRCGFPTSKDKQEKARCDAQKDRLKAVIAELQENSAILPALNDIPLLPADTFSHEQWDLLNALFEVLPILVAQLTLAFQETNTVDFTEISLKARQALGQLDDPSQLALKLDYQIQHILVDEFQDTSHSQIDLLQRLTAGWAPGDGRTLFCVGDAMQSIYGFRGANVGLFLHCRDHGLGHIPLEPLRLNTNFRSQAGIVNWVNRTFSRAFPAENDISRGAVTYSHSEAFHDDSGSPAVQIHAMIDQESNATEAQQMLSVIQETRSHNPEQSIAILVRSRNHASRIARLLTSNGIRYRALDLEPLENQSIIQDLLALTQAMLHPGDRTSWLAALRAPWCGLSLVDLDTIANTSDEDCAVRPTILQQVELALTASQRKNPKQPPKQNDFFAPSQSDTPQLTDDGRARLTRVLPLLKSGLAQRDRKPLRLWVEGLWIALNGPACLQDAADLTNAEKYLELLQQWPYATDLPGFFTIRDAVKKLFAAPDPKADDKLQIMTIHKSKGLEFDVVLLPGLANGTRPNTAGLLMWHQRLNSTGETDLIMAPLTAKGQEKHPTQHYLIAEDSKKTGFEACRLLYVACTRAKQKLYLFADLSTSKKDEAINKPGNPSLLYSIWDAIQLQLIRHESAAPITNNKKTKEPPALIRLPKNWQAPALSKGQLLESYIPRYQYDKDTQTQAISMPSPMARHVGTLIHRYLELIGTRGIEHWQADTLKHHQRHIRNSLKALGVPAAELDDACHKVTMAIELVLQDEKANEFLSNHHPFTANEYPITFKSQNGPKNLVIDRLYTNRKGTTWVVDYKTATPKPDQTPEVFLAEQKEHYAAKLKLYQSALQQAGFDKVKTALYFPMNNLWLGMDDDI